MFKNSLLLSLSLVLGGISLEAAPQEGGSYRGYPSYTPSKTGGDHHNELYEGKRQATGREEIAYEDARDQDIHSRANRKGDWDYHQNWRYNREAFYRGETQGEAYLNEHSEGSGGPGMYPDKEYQEINSESMRR